MSSESDRGQVAPLLALVMVAVGLACLGIGRFAAAAVDAAAARTAADAAALAGAMAGEDAARAVALENGAALVSWEGSGRDVRVRVRVGRALVSARARAGDGGGRSRSSGVSGAAEETSPPGSLAPAMRAALARAAQVLGSPVPVTSGVRTTAEQQLLFARRARNPYPVAPPGTSMHERGLAIDVPLAVAARLAPLSAETGLCRPYPAADPVHFELCGRGFASRGGG
jgi:hypothetical protein